MPIFFGSSANLTVSTSPERLSSKHSIAKLEIVDGGTLGDYDARALVGSSNGEGNVGKGAFDIFEVGVAEARDGDLEVEVMRGEVVDIWQGYCID